MPPAHSDPDVFSPGRRPIGIRSWFGPSLDGRVQITPARGRHQRRDETRPRISRLFRAILATIALLPITACLRADLQSRSAATARMPPAVELAEQSLEGRSLFLRNCATCHLGGGGLLGAPRTPDLFEEPLLRGESEDALLQTIRYGIDLPRMPAFGEGLSEEEIRSIVGYVMSRRSAFARTN